MTEERTEYTTYALIPTQENPYGLDRNLQPVDWRETREHFDPQGAEYNARDLVGRSFTIVEFRPVPSSYPGSDHFYYVKGVLDPDGELFHTSLGGQAVVEVLDSFDRLRAAYIEAKQLSDSERVAELEAIGAGRPVAVTLGFIQQGKYEGYYTFE